MENKKEVLTTLMGVLLVITLIPLIGYAAVPQQITYQGQLTDQYGDPVPDGDYDMVFAIYDVSTGGTALWGEAQTVTVTKGIYNVILGQPGNELDPTDFDGDLYLEVDIGGEILSPRQKLTSTAFAMKAALADNVVEGSVDTVHIMNSAVTNDKIGMNAVTGDKIAADSVTADDIDDGIGSGLDSDLLDGQQGSYYLNWSNLTGVPAGFDDGVDNDTIYSPGIGISFVGNQINNVGDTNPSDDLTVGTAFSGDVTGTYNSLNIASDAVGTAEVADGSLTELDLNTPVTGSGTATVDTIIRRFYRHQMNGVTRARVLVVGNGESEGAAAHVGIYVGGASETYSYDCPGGGARPWTYISPPFSIPSYLDVKYRVTAAGGGTFFWREVRLIPVDAQEGTVIVAKQGGDYATISDALAAIVPSSTAPYVIQVMPGVYQENVVMKSWVHLQGTGRDVTIIQPTSGDGIDVDELVRATVSGFTIQDGYYGIYVNGSNEDVTIVNNRFTGNGFGIYAYDADCIIRGNVFEDNNTAGLSLSVGAPLIQGNRITGNTQRGITCSNCEARILGNTVTKNGYDGIWIYNGSASPTVKGNVVLNNDWDGIVVSNYAYSTIIGNYVSKNGRNGIAVNSWARPRILNNRIYNNNVSAGGYTDIWVNDDMANYPYTPIISLNMYDTITGANGLGYYNVNNTGGLAPAP